ncbi:hypothetical protein LG634_37470 [Streptomyces bambusae]|uniref:hypothetical protein n=1 Tax=Streptomyces bambusae TaxID=1550616 RepID=UPI001CFF72D5|nr:hypothetical protein [Streptomyces bambusae]MCB5170468.1 hypothetical protein [Streptomyces bambusae]
MKKTTAVVAMTGMLMAGAAAPAMAGGNCGYRTSCTSLSNGKLTIFLATGTVANYLSPSVTYQKTGGSAVTVRLGYAYNGSDHWGSWYTQSAGTTKNKTWSNAYYISGCRSAVGLLDAANQQQFQTPPVTSC